MAMPPFRREAVLRLLTEHGKLTRPQLAHLMGCKPHSLTDAINYLHRRKGLIHIAGWKHSYGTGGRCAAMYAAGAGQDAAPPTSDHAAACRRYYDRVLRKKLGRMNRRVGPHGRNINPWAQLAVRT